MRRSTCSLTCLAMVVLTVFAVPHRAAAQPPRDVALARFVEAVREKARALESTAGMRLAFRSFTSTHGLSAETVSYSDFAVVRLLFESTWDAGLWNVDWRITDLLTTTKTLNRRGS